MGFSVRDAVPADHAAIGALTVEAYRADGQLEGGHGYERVLADAAGRAGAGNLLVAVDDDTGEVLGAVLLVLPGARFAEISTAGEAEFRMLAVAPGAQRRGIGRALTTACLDRAARMGCHAVVISVRDDRPDTQRMYASLGFTRIPERDFVPVPGVSLWAFRCDLDARLPDPGGMGNPAGLCKTAQPTN